LKEMLSDTGIEVLVTEPVLRGGSMVSSSRIRDAIRTGDFARARDMLTASYAIDLREVGSRSPDGSPLRIPRAEIVQVLPPEGEYAVNSVSPAGYVQGTCRIDSESLTLSAANSGSAAMVVFP
jgi:FAD synthase